MDAFDWCSRLESKTGVFVPSPSRLGHPNYHRAEGALSIVAPENIDENTSVLMTNSITAFIELVRVGAHFSSMSGCFLHLPRVYFSHNERPYTVKKSDHRSDLVLSARTHSHDSVLLCHIPNAPVFFWISVFFSKLSRRRKMKIGSIRITKCGGHCIQMPCPSHLITTDS